MARILLLSTADTELLAARASGADWAIGNPARLTRDEVPLGGVDVVVVRLLGGRRTWPEGLDAVLASGVPTVVLGGEATPDAELMALSTTPAGIAQDALAYLAEGGADNLRELHRFLSDTVLLTGEGFEPPTQMPAFGVYRDAAGDGKPVVGVVFYRAHALAGNTAFVDTLCDAVAAASGDPLAVFCASLRGGEPELFGLLERCDALVVTVLASGGTRASAASAGGDDEAWDIGELRRLDVPLVQGLCLTSAREAWQDSDAALSPMDAAMQVAIPEFDGRLITVPFSFKQPGPDGLPVYAADPERAARVAGIATRHAKLRHLPPAERRLAIVLSSYPTKHSRVGNAVGLDTPVPVAEYRRWFAALPAGFRESVTRAWGEPPGELYVDHDHLVIAGIRYGNVVLMIQPPRGFGENPIAIYHDPHLAPSHHYLAAYRWLELEFGADAVVHLGKHGTLEWLPGKGLGLSADCAPDAVLGDLPFVYPFIVNDPGEGTQAKRRGHATVVDHLVPPMARADTYGDLAKLEQLLDEHATVV